MEGRTIWGGRWRGAGAEERLWRQSWATDRKPRCARWGDDELHACPCAFPGMLHFASIAVEWLRAVDGFRESYTAEVAPCSCEEVRALSPACSVHSCENSATYLTQTNFIHGARLQTRLGTDPREPSEARRLLLLRGKRERRRRRTSADERRAEGADPEQDPAKKR